VRGAVRKVLAQRDSGRGAAQAKHPPASAISLRGDGSGIAGSCVFAGGGEVAATDLSFVFGTVWRPYKRRRTAPDNHWQMKQALARDLLPL
jgi:hypothetical protein